MCTVTFIPIHKNKFILTTNRDETPYRSPNSISEKIGKDGEKILFPKDTRAGGTWIAASTNSRLVCILNGAFKKHKHDPPYRRSRGLVALDFFDYSAAADFFEAYDFRGIEPFTIIIFERNELYEMRWDGRLSHIKPLKTHHYHIWSSAPLYTPEVQQKRDDYFYNWVKNTSDFSSENILKLHREGGIGDSEQDFIMNRNNIVRTVSITQVIRAKDKLTMQYFNLLNEQYAVAHELLNPQFQSNPNPSAL